MNDVSPQSFWYKGQMSQLFPRLWGSCLGPSLQLPGGPCLRQTPTQPWFSMYVCVYLKAHEESQPNKFSLNSWITEGGYKRPEWRRMCFCSPYKNKGRGENMGERERRKKESRVRMTKRLTGVTVKKHGYTQTDTNRKKGKKCNFFVWKCKTGLRHRPPNCRLLT